jgi:hypothetical protein
MSQTRAERRKRSPSVARGPESRFPRQFRQGRNTRQVIVSTAPLQSARSFEELRTANIQVFEALTKEINDALRVLSKYMNEDGQIVRGGLADQAIMGNAFSDDIVNNFQDSNWTAGSPLTDLQWAQTQ